MAVEETTEVLSLSIKDLSSMKKEFYDCYDELFDYENNRKLLSRALKI